MYMLGGAAGAPLTAVVVPFFCFAVFFPAGVAVSLLPLDWSLIVMLLDISVSTSSLFICSWLPEIINDQKCKNNTCTCILYMYIW